MRTHKATSAKGVITECGLEIKRYAWPGFGGLRIERKKPLKTQKRWGVGVTCLNCRRTAPPSQRGY